ncbi:ShlB/FhaC/HecB family hemolysin secretion/activation protein [Methylocaldum gracile]|jgi:hemolysin activation/secretion protein|uniref:ShlB/FhaC/HecB family hemolysin secretion/activation protein n=1 Tax=unclassified Methylocaldum TaxID=2622260 RepID=UPI00106149C1
MSLLVLLLSGFGEAWAEPPGAGTAAPDAATEVPAEQPIFDVMEYLVEGNTVLESKTVEKTVYPFLGLGKSIDDVEKAREALEAAYHKAGFQTVLVDIPEQDVDQGIVRLQVTEGQVERLKITGSRYYSLGKIREGVPALAKGEIPNMPAVQGQLAKLGGESPDREITPILRAGSTPGKLEVELQVKDRLPLHGSVEMNGRNSEGTSRSRLIASLRYDNLWQRFHSASLQYQVSPENYDEVEVWAGTYVLPTGIADTRLALYGVGISSNTQIATAGALSVVGTGNIFGLRVVKPLEPLDGYFHSLTFGFDYKEFNQGLSLVGQDQQNTPITYAPFTLSYDGTWRDESAVTAMSLASHFSVRGLGNEQKEFEDKRFGARANYLYFTADLRHERELPLGLRFLAKGAGQVTDSPLISNEQFAVGGPQSVRGYYQTQQLGDHGVNLSVELQSPALIAEGWGFTHQLRALAFFDWAYLWIVDPLPANPSFYRLASAGAGLRLRMFQHVTGELDWGYPLYSQGTVDVGEQRVDFRVAYEF